MHTINKYIAFLSDYYCHMKGTRKVQNTCHCPNLIFTQRAAPTTAMMNRASPMT